MRIHLIVDFQYNYYRNKCSYERQMAYRGAKRLSCVLDGKEVDTTYPYLVLKDIERYRKMFVNGIDDSNNIFQDDPLVDNEVTVSIAADSKIVTRKETSAEYKSNRSGRLDESDFEAIDRTLEILSNVGYNVYRLDGFEADDIIRNLVLRYKDDYDITVIFSNDADILVNVDDNVVVERFKSSERKHTLITKDTFSENLSKEYKCNMPYNCIALYKCLVGDKSDKISGVRGFGPAAFDKAVYAIESRFGSDYFVDLSNNYDKLVDTLNFLVSTGNLKPDKLHEALLSLELVLYKVINDGLKKPEKMDNDELRVKEYSRYAMFSLLK